MQCRICRSKDTRQLFEHHDNNYYVDRERYAVYKCNNCGVGFVGNPPALQKMPEYYPKTYYAYSTSANIFFKMKEKFLKLSMGLPRKLSDTLLFSQLYFRPNQIKSTVLDIGCGDGSALYLLDKLGFSKLIGTEIDKNNCREISKKYGYKVHHTVSIQGLSYCKSISEVRMSHVLEHVYDPLETVKKIHSMLQADGRLYIGVPNFSSVASKLFGVYYCGLQLPTHLYHFDRNSIRSLLEDNGFEIKKIHTVGLSGIAMSLVIFFEDRHKYKLGDCIKLILVIIFLPIEFILNLLGRGFMMNVEAVKVKK